MGEVGKGVIMKLKDAGKLEILRERDREEGET